jgi:hypothetical protein
MLARATDSSIAQPTRVLTQRTFQYVPRGAHQGRWVHRRALFPRPAQAYLKGESTQYFPVGLAATVRQHTQARVLSTTPKALPLQSASTLGYRKCTRAPCRSHTTHSCTNSHTRHADTALPVPPSLPPSPGPPTPLNDHTTLGTWFARRCARTKHAHAHAHAHARTPSKEPPVAHSSPHAPQLAAAPSQRQHESPAAQPPAQTGGRTDAESARRCGRRTALRYGRRYPALHSVTVASICARRSARSRAGWRTGTERGTLGVLSGYSRWVGADAQSAPGLARSASCGARRAAVAGAGGGMPTVSRGAEVSESTPRAPLEYP